MPAPLDPRIHAQALADFTTGMGVRAVARRYGISQSTASAWHGEARGTVQAVVRTQKQHDLGGLVVDYLEEALITLTAHVRLARDQEWFMRQNAADLAIFHGVLVDKTTRILSAMQPGQGDVDDEGPEG